MKPLSGRVIALPESRELELLARMVEQRGGVAIRCPLVDIHDTPDPEPVRVWIDDLIAGRMDDLILLTGEGVRRLNSFAVRMERHQQWLDALANVRKITRGPKPIRALRELGLSHQIKAEHPTTDGVIETLRGCELAGRTVGVQLYGQNPNRKLMDFLSAAGAAARPVAPYVYADASETRRVCELINSMAEAEVDVIAFTSAAQVTRLFNVAQKHEMSDMLRHGLAHTKVAAIGPIAADELKSRDIRIDAMPDRTFFMKPLLEAICRALG